MAFSHCGSGTSRVPVARTPMCHAITSITGTISGTSQRLQKDIISARSASFCRYFVFANALTKLVSINFA